MNDEEENELVVEDVPETSQVDLSEIETDTSEEVNETQNNVVDNATDSDEDVEKKIEERANQLFEEKIEKRLVRDRVKQEEKHKQEMQKYNNLLDMLNNGLGTTNIDDATNKLSEFYKEQGVNIQTKQQVNNLTERQERILAEAEAKEIKECGIDEMKYEANRIMNIPPELRTTKEKIIFSELAQEIVNRKNINELKQKGYDTKILDSEDFRKFRNRFTPTESISDIYEMYQKIGGVEKKKEPRSPGSAKGIVSDNEIKELYTPEEVRKFTEEDLKNPKLMKAVEYSMTQWGRSSK